MKRCEIMGILNVTPDSFSDGGRYASVQQAVDAASLMLEAGADLIDVGGESTRPGADRVSAQEETDRVLPVVEALTQLGIPVSVDTQKTAVMQAVLAYPIRMINDVNALQAEGAEALLAQHETVQVCLMHKQGEPKTMQDQPIYRDAVHEVCEFLRQRASDCEQAGIARDRLVLDPGFGFGKTQAHNYQLLRQLESVVDLGYPVLIGLSRKRMFADIASEVSQRLIPSVTAAMIAVMQGASIVRVHDVQATREALTVVEMTYGT